MSEMIVASDGTSLEDLRPRFERHMELCAKNHPDWSEDRLVAEAALWCDRHGLPAGSLVLSWDVAPVEENPSPEPDEEPAPAAPRPKAKAKK